MTTGQTSFIQTTSTASLSGRAGESSARVPGKEFDDEFSEKILFPPGWDLGPTPHLEIYF
jgi:hypothetical protein